MRAARRRLRGEKNSPPNADEYEWTASCAVRPRRPSLSADAGESVAPPLTGASPGTATAPPPLVQAACALRCAVASALRAGDLELAELLLEKLRDLATESWAPAAARGELARALGVFHIVSWREESEPRAQQALAELTALARLPDAGAQEREQLARAWSREYGIADRSGDLSRAEQALATLRSNAHTTHAVELDRTLLARALYRGHRSQLSRTRREDSARLLAELRAVARDPRASTEDRLYFARALIDAVWMARNPGSRRSRALRTECLEILDAMRTEPTARALRMRLP